jgi:hypothetical protein
MLFKFFKLMLNSAMNKKHAILREKTKMGETGKSHRMYIPYIGNLYFCHKKSYYNHINEVDFHNSLLNSLVLIIW